MTRSSSGWDLMRRLRSHYNATRVNSGPLPRVAGPPTQATLLNTGNALASGTRCIYSGSGQVATNGCFLYTTSTNSWSIAGGMNHARLGHSSTLLPSGEVLVAGVAM
jgi:hypothetical protein